MGNETVIALVEEEVKARDSTAPTEEDATVESRSDEAVEPEQPLSKNNETAVTTTTYGKKRPPFKYDPDKLTLRFLFANRDGLAVTIDCKPADTVGEVKGALLSVWPDDLPPCSGGERLRLICMGKGILMPDTRSLEDCQVPVFRTHPTPVNVSVKPELMTVEPVKTATNTSSTLSLNRNNSQAAMADQGCVCVIL